MGMLNRRIGNRIPLQMFLNEYIRDQEARCMSTNLSPEGIYLNRLIQPIKRPKPVVGLEFELPGTSEIIWARGEIRFDYKDNYFHGTGIQFTGMATYHERLIKDYVYELKAKRLRQILATIRRNRMC